MSKANLFRTLGISDAVIIIEAKSSKPGIILHSMESDFKLLGEILKVAACVHFKLDIVKE